MPHHFAFRWRCRSWFTTVTVGIGLCVPFTQRALEAQATQTLSTSVSIDAGGNAVIATAGDGPAYHPARVLVRFRNGARAGFLPGSGPPTAFPMQHDLFL